MLTIFHTADWHLGQSFFGFDRNFEHEAFLQWLLRAFEQHKPDALVIAGDVFDNINPSSASTRLYYNFLADTRRLFPDLHIVVTAGNHDSGNRLEAPADLLKALSISVVGTVTRNADGAVDVNRFIVPLKDTTDKLQAIIIAVPFLRPAEVPRVADADDAYLDGIRVLYKLATQAAVELRDEYDADVPIIALGHCHVQGGIESRDSERRLVIGGAEALSPHIFPSELSYTALGHLHKAQTFCDRAVQYSGSPIPLSFSEREYEHRVLKLQFEGRDLVDCQPLVIPTPVPLLTVPASGAASLEDVLSELKRLKCNPTLPFKQQPLLEVRILDDGPDPMRRKKIEDELADSHVRLVSIKLDRAESTTHNTTAATLNLSDLQTIDPEQVLRLAWQNRYDGEPSDDLLAAFREIVSQQDAVQ